MKPSSATGIRSFRPLNALKSIIHPPLPLTAGQSQQLLGLLKTSFREQLAASTAESASNAGNATEPHRSPVDAHLNGLLKAPVFTSSNKPAARTLGRVEQVRVERFIRDPLAVYHEVSSQGIPTPDIAWAVLKRHTANMLSSPKEKLEDGWAVKVVLEVIKPLRILSSRIHLEDSRLRQQIIRTLVQGGDEGVAAGMLNKPWLLHISPEQPDAKVLLEIRRSIIQEVTKTVEAVNGLNAATTRFLAMHENWQSNVETVLGGADSNPFMTTGQYLLLRYAHKQDSEASQLRQKIYETCTPWIRSKFAKARLMLYYENNPYRLYGIVMRKGDLKKLAGVATICMELILSLVQHQELDKARKVVSLMRTNFVGSVPGLEPALVDEVEMLLNAPGVNIRTRLVAMIAESTRRFTEETFDIMPDILEPRQKFTLA